ncbi:MULTISPECIES: hypothetical protein [Actinobacillus]|uniref:Uncharacterized protein n=2 Tax=Actinobacillus suis TaxID=716 RepID=K0G365_ACTSU|nr:MULTISPECIES: hypothetical protein [Actinobacillus]AFU18666.1 hypothetical protein ASU2_02620 [Actinobacillus suis H91-0380]MCO4167098.1 hypothetical protein [Actinobacillus suis]MCO4169221.1 hypothetical protein [Actinobacillus suis]MCQ9629825.1 hypothetical protein [Actinobacillus suis]MCQ9632231.1 hypothetical protein [Actinobacillus suis]
METDNIISSLSLLVSIIGIPIGYYLGGRNIRNSAYNAAIDDLEKLCQKIFDESMQIHKNGDRSESNYHLMIANHKLLQSKCSSIQCLKNNQTGYPRNELREVKQIITGQLFSEDSEEQNTAIRNLIYKLTPLIEHYPKKFY